MNALVDGYEWGANGRSDVMDDIGEAATLLAEEGVRGPVARAVEAKEEVGWAKEGPVDGVEGSADGTGQTDDRAGQAEESADHVGRGEGSATENLADGLADHAAQGEDSADHAEGSASAGSADGSADHVGQGESSAGESPASRDSQENPGFRPSWVPLGQDRGRARRSRAFRAGLGIDSSPRDDSVSVGTGVGKHDDSVSAGTGVGKQMAALVAPSPQDDRVLAVERNKLFEAMFQVPAEPQRLGRYVVLGTLGKGGMGVVFKAFDPELDRQVALKVLHTELDEQHTIRLRREAQAMAKLSHPNVVQVHEVGQAEGQTFVAMELVGGQTLKEWMRQEPRPTWRQCVEVFVQVGAGLAAAHEQGLIHRDFKPGNAIIDDNGRARVLDFGLARQIGESLNADPDPDPNADPNADPDLVSRSVQRARTKGNQVGPLDVSLTNTGAVLGTPAYMPPEQMKGQPADARSDQFSFCVALYEAVYGERPFEGGNMAGLMISMMNAEVKPAPKGSPVPAILRTMLLRGLAFDPDDRWLSMEALLGELQRLLVPRRWRWLGGGLALGLVGLGTTLAAPQFVAMQERCSGAQAQLAGIWDDTRRQDVKDAVLGTELSYAESTWQRIEPKLDDYADAWADKHTEVCEATTVRHEQTEDAMTLRRGCLHERRTALRATVTVLADTDANTKTMENAVKLVAGLPDLARCDDVERLEQQRQRMPPPEDPQVAEAVDQLREQLADIKAMDKAGRYAEALKQVKPVVEQAEALDYGPLRTEAKYRQGELLNRDGQYARAEPELKQAYVLALEHEHDQVELDTAQTLTFVVGDRLARHDDGQTWGQAALALAKRSDDDLELAGSLGNLGVLSHNLGEHEQAKQHLQRALRIKEKALGPDHPHVATSLTHLGSVFKSLGDYEQTKQHFQRALRIEERALAPDHPNVATSLASLGTVFYDQGDYEQAKQHYQRALRIWEKALGPDHPHVAYVLGGLANVFYDQGEYEQAKQHLQQASRIREKALGSDHPRVADSLVGLANVALAQRDTTIAREHAERAVSILEKSKEAPELVAEARFVLAKVLWSDKTHRGRARALAEQTREIFAEIGTEGKVQEYLAKVETWLATHRVK